MIAQSTFLCSFNVTVASESKVLGFLLPDFDAFTTSFATALPTLLGEDVVPAIGCPAVLEGPY